MKEESNIDRLLDEFFVKERRQIQGMKLENSLRNSLKERNIRRIRMSVIGIASMILLAIGIFFAMEQKTSKNPQIAESKILYQDKNMIIYIE